MYFCLMNELEILRFQFRTTTIKNKPNLPHENETTEPSSLLQDFNSVLTCMILHDDQINTSTQKVPPIV
jgi:hypothetical protein